MFDAIIRSKLIYGLESAHLTETLKKKIDVFHRKGLRQIMKVLTTYGQKENGMAPTNDNDMLLRMVNAKINTWEARKRKATTLAHFSRTFLGNIKKLST